MNQETEKLYYEDVYLKTFTAKVVTCCKQDENFSVVLNRTAFYPEGGGQPGDIGVLNTVNVLDVHEYDGQIIHTTDKALEVGTTVTGGINWPHRLSLMQQHSGEHIVSGIANRFFGLDNVGFHMGSKVVTVDFNGELSEDNLALIELLANEAVYRDIPLKVTYPSSGELAVLNYRSKKELTGQVRIVTVPGYDVCACCGTHVAMTGEIGIIKILSLQRYKGGTRVNLLCGSKAVADYNEKEKSVNAISALLSAKKEEIQNAVSHLLEENNALKQQIVTLHNQVFAFKAASVQDGVENICIFEMDLAPSDLRKFCSLLCERCSGVVAVLSGSDRTQYKYALGSASVDVRALGKELNSTFYGRGGGSKELVQGSVKAMQIQIEHFFNNIT